MSLFEGPDPCTLHLGKNFEPQTLKVEVMTPEPCLNLEPSTLNLEP
jgi:hypothetical protein